MPSSTAWFIQILEDKGVTRETLPERRWLAGLASWLWYRIGGDDLSNMMPQSECWSVGFPSFFGCVWAPKATTAAVAVLCLVVFIPATDFGNSKNSPLLRSIMIQGHWSSKRQCASCLLMFLHRGWNDFDSILFLDFGRVAWAMSWATITLLCYYGSLDEISNLFVHGCFSQENGSEAICHGRMLSWHILVGSPLSA